ncbi:MULTISPECIES: prepilin peptidase [unclassified Methylobacterium]|uniref:A24 family peptidase n=1 Tax=unclassified Methylobacterium TaxID=2615210 RepID=UPI0011C2004E|nr:MULTISPECIES: prepilin peptidase [unclassified Methylobacterium]QEE42383.1 hypothetical protein FVA80_29095 [Methylobacterium sp. WL1]TXN59672.1 hypothetical protein FV241_01920 [Methylobacterium sp. WL2]
MRIPLGLVLPLLLWAALGDLLYRKIDNRLVVALGVMWLAMVGSGGLQQSDSASGAIWQILQTVLGASAVIGIGFILFCRGHVGAGDVKLTAALCLWVGADRQVFFVLTTSLFGGALVVAMPILSAAETALALLWMSGTRRVPALGSMGTPHCLSGQPIRGLPYALAIVAGALVTLTAP